MKKKSLKKNFQNLNQGRDVIRYPNSYHDYILGLFN